MACGLHLSESPHLSSVQALPALKPRETLREDGRVAVKIALSPEVLEAFKTTGRDWQDQMNTTLLALIGK